MFILVLGFSDWGLGLHDAQKIRFRAVFRVVGPPIFCSVVQRGRCGTQFSSARLGCHAR